MLPFKETHIENNQYLREFEESVDIDDLEWHRDREDRIVEIIGETDWQFQMDNELPKKLNGKVFIPISITLSFNLSNDSFSTNSAC